MLVLVTDLDGTFLGGTPEQFSELAERLAAMGDDARLVYCSGRARHKILPLIDSGRLPRPDAIIGDVGTSLWDGHGEVLSHPVTTAIAERWGDGRSRVEAALATVPDLLPQAGCGPNRMSYTYTHIDAVATATPIVEAMGFDALVSDGVYFDVLPKGINKGATVLALIRLWALAPEHVVVAGDTLNDLSMFHTGLPGVVVGNAEPALLAALPPRLPTYRARAHGAGGILEGLRHFGHLPSPTTASGEPPHV